MQNKPLRDYKSLANNSFTKFHFGDIICTGAVVLQHGIGIGKIIMDDKKEEIQLCRQYKCLWDYKSVTVATQGLISENVICTGLTVLQHGIGKHMKQQWT